MRNAIKGAVKAPHRAQLRSGQQSIAVNRHSTKEVRRVFCDDQHANCLLPLQKARTPHRPEAQEEAAFSSTQTKPRRARQLNAISVHDGIGQSAWFLQGFKTCRIAPKRKPCPHKSHNLDKCWDAWMLFNHSSVSSKVSTTPCLVSALALSAGHPSLQIGHSGPRATAADVNIGTSAVFRHTHPSQLA